MRVIHAVRELNAQRAEPICVIALYTEAERDAMFVRDADEAVALERRLPRPRATWSARWCEARADAAWVGWGFVAEHPEFAELCERLGIVFVGPDAAVMRLVGDKIAAKRLAEEAGVPVAPWSGGPVDTRRGGAAPRGAHRLPADDQGHRRRRRARHPPRRRARRARRPRSPARRPRPIQAFGDGTVLLERLITPARHIEVQVIADGHGAAWAVGVRDCTYQRRNQKVIEESASPALTAEQEREVMQAARRLALRAGYRNAGTVEFLYEPGTRALLVHGGQRAPAGRAPRDRGGHRARPRQAAAPRRRRRPARGRAAAAQRPRRRGAPERRGSGAAASRPAPGRIALLRLPTGPGRARRHRRGRGRRDPGRVRLDDRQAHRLGPRPRRGARAPAPRARRHDGRRRRRDHQPGLPARAARPPRGPHRRGRHRRGWTACTLDGEIVPVRHADVALLQAAIELAEARDGRRPRALLRARPPRPPAGRRATLARTVELRHRGQTYRLAVAQIAPAATA